MNLSSKLKKIITSKYFIKVVISIIISIGLAMVISALPPNRLYQIAQETLRENKYGVENTVYRVEELHTIRYLIDGDSFVVEEGDPQMTLSMEKTYVENVLISFSDATKEKLTVEVYFAENEGEYSAAQLLLVDVPVGAESIFIPVNQVSDDLRIDIGMEPGQKFSLMAIEINSNHTTMGKKIAECISAHIFKDIYYSRVIIFSLIFVFGLSFFVFGFRNTFDCLFEKRWLVGLLFLIFMVANKYHGNSITMFDSYVQHGEGSSYIRPVFGVERGIRSDEWLVDASQSLSTRYLEDPYGNINYITRGADTINTNGISIATVLNPITLIGLILKLTVGFDYAYSFNWYAAPVLAFLFQIELFMILTKKNRLWSSAGAFLVVFSSFSLWWGFPTMFTYAPGALVCFYHFFEEKMNWRKVAYAYGTGLFAALFIIILYPAWQVPMGYLCLAILTWMIICKWEVIRKQTWKEWGLIFLAAAVCALIVIFTLLGQMEYIQAITQTEYPGSRVDYGGFKLDKLFYYIPALLFSVKRAGNPCELGTLITFFPLSFVAGVLFAVRTKNKNIRRLIVALLGISVIFAWYCFTELPHGLAHILLMDYSTSSRCVDILSYTQLIVLVIVAGNWENERKLNWYISVPIGLASMGIGIYYSYQYTNIKIPGYMTKAFLVIVGIIIAMISIGYITKMKSKLINLVPIGMILFALVTGALVRPIVKGTEAIDSKPLAYAIRDVVEDDPKAKWIAYGGSFVFPGYTVSCGAPTINSVNTYPNMEMWHTLDPEEKYNEIYNRYAHIDLALVDDETHMELIQADLLRLYLSVDDIQKLEVKYIASLVELDFENSNFELEKLYSEKGAYIYKIKY